MLYLQGPPFAFLWSGYVSDCGRALAIASPPLPCARAPPQHCLLAPAASHSGYEDVMQSDQFHYTHHRYSECNYGTSSYMLDRVFGTVSRRGLISASQQPTHPARPHAQFRDHLHKKKSSYKGAAEGSALTGASMGASMEFVL